MGAGPDHPCSEEAGTTAPWMWAELPGALSAKATHTVVQILGLIPCLHVGGGQVLAVLVKMKQAGREEARAGPVGRIKAHHLHLEQGEETLTSCQRSQDPEGCRYGAGQSRAWVKAGQSRLSLEKPCGQERPAALMTVSCRSCH